MHEIIQQWRVGRVNEKKSRTRAHIWEFLLRPSIPCMKAENVKRYNMLRCATTIHGPSMKLHYPPLSKEMQR